MEKSRMSRWKIQNFTENYWSKSRNYKPRKNNWKQKSKNKEKTSQKERKNDPIPFIILNYHKPALSSWHFISFKKSYQIKS